MADGDNKVLVSYEKLFQIGMKALKLTGVSKVHAETTMEILLLADLRGVGTHGIHRLLTYIPRIRQGLINRSPNIVVQSLGPAVAVIDGDNGLGPVVGKAGMDEAIRMARDCGIGFVGCRNSNHFGAAAPYVLTACRQKMIGIVGANAPPTMAPWGGLTRLLGNNPLAIGVPCEGDFPFVIDIAMSSSSRARIFQMASKGVSIPADWALDREGRPTTDAAEAIKGFVIPIGRHKGYGLAAAIDILSGVLTGGAFSTSVKSLLESWDTPQRICHFFVALDVTRFMPFERFSTRIRELFSAYRNAKRINKDVPIYVPGERGSIVEMERRQNGIPLDRELFRILVGLSEGKYDYEIPKF